MPYVAPLGRSDLTREEIHALTRTPKAVPARLSKLFGAEAIHAFTRVFENPDLAAMDALRMSGDISDNEIEEYQMLLPELHAVRRDLFASADLLAEGIRGKIPYYVDRTFTKSGAVSPTQGLISLEECVEALIASQSFHGVHAARHLLLYDFHKRLSGWIGFMMLADLMGRGDMDRASTLYNTFGSIQQELLSQFSGMLFPFLAMQVGDQQSRFWEAHQRETAPFFEAVRASAQLPEGQRDARAWNNVMFEEISALSYIRHIRPLQARVGPFWVRVSGDGLAWHARHRGTQICFVEILEDSPDALASKPFVETPGNERLVSVHEAGESRRILFQLDRSTGELIPFGSGIPLEAYYPAGSPDVEAIRGAALSVLYEDLRSREDDPPLPSRTDAEVIDAAPIAEETREQIAWSFTPPIRKSGMETETTLETPASSFRMTLLRNRSSDDVKRALIRLLGKPVSIEGSHHVFRCRDGRRYPISFHPKETVGIGLLKKCLQSFQIDPEEFYKELG